MEERMDTPDPLQYQHEGNDNEGSTADDLAGEGDTMMTNEDNPESVQTRSTGGAKYEEPDVPTNYSLFSNPPNLGIMRERLFKLDDPIQLSPLDFDAYFKYVDNIWRKEKSSTQQSSDGTTTDTYICRIKKDPAAKAAAKAIPDEQRKRKKVARGDVDCDMTMKVIYTGGAIPTCTVIHAGKGIKHTHELSYADEKKRCTGIMDVARKEANKGFLASSTFEKMWSEPDKMRDAGGAHMKVSDARNVQIPWRDANRDTPYKIHTGFTGKRDTIGRKSRISAATAAFSSAKVKQTPKSRETITQLPRSTQIPPGTLRYPDHARLFLEDFMPTELGSRTRPHVTLTYASSLDGRISLGPGVRTAISGPETKAMTHYLRSRHDAILIGVRTAIADNPSLNSRLAGVGGYGGPGQERQPRPIIIDPDGRLQVRPEMKILQVVAKGRARAPWIIVKPSAQLRDEAVKTLKRCGGEYLSIKSEPNGKDISWSNILNALFAYGIRSVMVEGGGLVLSELLKPRHAHLLDSVVVTIAPTFMGKAGIAVSPDPTVDQDGQPMAMRLQNVRWQPMGDEDVVMCGRLQPLEPPINGILSGLEHFANAAGPAPQTNGFAPVNGRGAAAGRA